MKRGFLSTGAAKHEPCPKSSKANQPSVVRWPCGATVLTPLEQVLLDFHAKRHLQASGAEFRMQDLRGQSSDGHRVAGPVRWGEIELASLKWRFGIQNGREEIIQTLHPLSGSTI